MQMCFFLAVLVSGGVQYIFNPPCLTLGSRRDPGRKAGRAGLNLGVSRHSIRTGYPCGSQNKTCTARHPLAPDRATRSPLIAVDGERVRVIELQPARHRQRWGGVSAKGADRDVRRGLAERLNELIRFAWRGSIDN